MTTIIKGFLSVMRRYRLTTILNVLGLSVAFAAFILMMMKVNSEYGFDRCHPNADRIYRVDWLRNGEPATILPRAFADAIIASSPQIKEGTIITPLDEWMGDVYLTTGDEANRKGFHLPFETCYPGITRIFGFDFTEGDPNCLDAPGNAIIPQSIARRMFANETAIGKQLHPDNIYFLTNGQTLTVGGVYRDFPDNTQVKNVIYTAIGQTQKNDWSSQNYLLYILFNDKSEAKAFEDHFNQTFDFSPLATNGQNSISLMPLTDVYFSGTGFKTGNVNMVRILFAIALLVIIIAAINCMNFSIAMTPVRIRGINTRKILGCSTATLRISMLGEALITAFVSWLLALFLVAVLTERQYLSFMEADLHLQNDVPLVMLTGLAALITGVVAGLYPAFYSTSFQPALVLKGSFGLSPAGRKLRTVLIGFQYVISICLIIAALFIQKQNRYLQNFDTGFDREHIAIVKLNADICSRSKDLYAGKLKAYAGIDDVAFSKQKVGASDSYTWYSFKYNDREFSGYTLEVSENFLDVMRIPIIEGRNFIPSDTTGRKIAFVLNKPLKESVGIKAGETMEMTSWGNPVCNVAGITDDVKFTSLRQKQDHIIFLTGSSYALPFSYVRLKAGTNVFDAIDYIRRTVAGIDPAFPVEVEFYDDVFQRLYLKEINLNRNISSMSLLAIIISIVGIFGLILLETQYRRKEIGVRKVFGSTSAEILSLFNRTYIRILCVSFALAAPAAYYGVTRWLENFAYKTPMDWWVYLLAFAVVLALTAATVTFQNWRAASANPVDSIKTE
ncbi:MAG: ABC transporter permease [Tannerella sp.]|jgi:putative ABC transport system permease protein|nr:ABC transporter permease [Tannerella sp.]